MLALETSLVLRAQRLRAFVMGKEPNFSASDKYASLAKVRYPASELIEVR